MDGLMSLYSVYDSVADEYSAPNMAKNDGVAIRQFQELLVKLPLHVRDEYQLTKVGQFDTERGMISPFGYPQRIDITVDSKKVENE